MGSYTFETKVFGNFNHDKNYTQLVKTTGKYSYKIQHTKTLRTFKIKLSNGKQLYYQI